MNGDGPHLVFAFGIAVMSSTAAWSYGLSWPAGFLIGIHLAALYDFHGRAKIAHSVVEYFIPAGGAAIDLYPIWLGVVFIDVFMIGSHLRWF